MTRLQDERRELEQELQVKEQYADRQEQKVREKVRQRLHNVSHPREIDWNRWFRQDDDARRVGKGDVERIIEEEFTQWRQNGGARA